MSLDAVNPLIDKWNELQLPEKPPKKGKSPEKYERVLIQLKENTETKKNEVSFLDKDKERKGLGKRRALSKNKKDYAFAKISKEIKSKFENVFVNRNELKKDDFAKVKGFVDEYNKLATHVAEKKAKKSFGFFKKLILGKANYEYALQHKINQFLHEFKILGDWKQQQKPDLLIKELKLFQKRGQLRAIPKDPMSKEDAKKVKNTIQGFKENINNMKKALGKPLQANQKLSDEIEQLLKALQEVDGYLQVPEGKEKIQLTPKQIEKYNECQQLIQQFQQKIVTQGDTVTFEEVAVQSSEVPKQIEKEPVEKDTTMGKQGNVSFTQSHTVTQTTYEQKELTDAKNMMAGLFKDDFVPIINKKNLGAPGKIQEAIEYYGSVVSFDQLQSVCSKQSSKEIAEKDTVVTNMWKDVWSKELAQISSASDEIKEAYQSALNNCENLKEVCAIGSPSYFCALCTRGWTARTGDNEDRLKHMATHWPDELFKKLPISILLGLLVPAPEVALNRPIFDRYVDEPIIKRLWTHHKENFKQELEKFKEKRIQEFTFTGGRDYYKQSWTEYTDSIKKNIEEIQNEKK